MESIEDFENFPLTIREFDIDLALGAGSGNFRGLKKGAMGKEPIFYALTREFGGCQISSEGEFLLAVYDNNGAIVEWERYPIPKDANHAGQITLHLKKLPEGRRRGSPDLDIYKTPEPLK